MFKRRTPHLSHLSSHSPSQQGSNSISAPKYQYTHALRTSPSTAYDLLVLFLHLTQEIQMPGFCSLCCDHRSWKTVKSYCMWHWDTEQQVELSWSPITATQQNTPLHWQREAVSIYNSEVILLLPSHCKAYRQMYLRCYGKIDYLIQDFTCSKILASTLITPLQNCSSEGLN